MILLNSFITQSLSPALAISGISILISGINNRVMTLGGRIRDINKDIRTNAYDQNPRGLKNAFRQIELFLQRTRMLRNALFVLYASLSLMVFTAFAIAMTQLHLIVYQHLPILTFLTGLVLVLVGIGLEAYEISLNLKTLRLDIDSTLQWDSVPVQNPISPD